jgi:carbamoyl-phosphate synthase small subunit
MRGIVTTDVSRLEQAIEEAKTIAPMEGLDLVQHVTCPDPFIWRDDMDLGNSSEVGDFTLINERSSKQRFRIAAYDFGMKWNILRRLTAYGCDVHVFPATSPASDLLAIAPHGIFLSNGPGDPAPLDYAVANARELIASDVPMFGICLGHQVLGLALGGKTYKLKFGHRGANHPVKNLATDRIEITSQNHGFAIDSDSLSSDVEVTHVNLYDGTVEGLRHTTRPVFAVQYHPEASPGPHDADYLFQDFIDAIESRG